MRCDLQTLRATGSSRVRDKGSRRATPSCRRHRLIDSSATGLSSTCPYPRHPLHFPSFCPVPSLFHTYLVPSGVFNFIPLPRATTVTGRPLLSITLRYCKVVGAISRYQRHPCPRPASGPGTATHLGAPRRDTGQPTALPLPPHGGPPAVQIPKVPTTNVLGPPPVLLAFPAVCPSHPSLSFSLPLSFVLPYPRRRHRPPGRLPAATPSDHRHHRLGSGARSPDRIEQLSSGHDPLPCRNTDTHTSHTTCRSTAPWRPIRGSTPTAAFRSTRPRATTSTTTSNNHSSSSHRPHPHQVRHPCRMRTSSTARCYGISCASTPLRD